MRRPAFKPFFPATAGYLVQTGKPVFIQPVCQALQDVSDELRSLIDQR